MISALETLQSARPILNFALCTVGFLQMWGAEV